MSEQLNAVRGATDDMKELNAKLYPPRESESLIKATIREEWEEKHVTGIYNYIIDNHEWKKLALGKIKEIAQNLTLCQCGNWCLHDDMTDTEQRVGGGVGEVCPTCWKGL